MEEELSEKSNQEAAVGEEESEVEKQDKAQDEGKQEEIQCDGDEDQAIQSDGERVKRGKEAAAVSTEPGSHTIPTEPR